MKKIITIGLALVLSLALVVPAMAQGSVVPSEVDIETYPGAVIEVDKDVTTSPIPPNPDIIFLCDTTASMMDVIANMQANVGTIMTTVQTVEPGAQFGAAQYRDAGDTPVYELSQALTADTSAVQTAVNGWSAAGGGDIPEAQLYALNQLATDPAVGFREGPNRIIVWMGDSSGHDPTIAGVTEAMATGNLTTNGIRVIAIPVDSGYGDGLDATGQATRITVATGGVLLPDAAPGEVSDAILAGLAALTTDVWGVVGATPPGITVALDPDHWPGVLGATTVQFDETITVAPDTEPGEYTIVVTFYENTWGEEGEVIGTEEITIEVLPLVEVEKHWSYTDVCFMQDNDGDGLYDEDGPEYDASGELLLIDNDEDGLVDEDPVECGGEYSLGTELTQLEATVKNDTIKNINPGQFYAVSTVEVLEDLDQLVITEDYSDVISSGIGELNPRKGGGKVVVVQMDGETPVQILDAMDEAVVVDLDTEAVITLENVVAGDVYKVYVKFEPTLKGSAMDEYVATNLNCADAYVDEYHQHDCAEAIIEVVEKVGDED